MSAQPPQYERDFGPCIAWAWQVGNVPMGCTRKRDCGAVNVEFCPEAPRQAPTSSKGDTDHER